MVLIALITVDPTIVLYTFNLVHIKDVYKRQLLHCSVSSRIILEINDKEGQDPHDNLSEGTAILYYDALGCCYLNNLTRFCFTANLCLIHSANVYIFIILKLSYRI